MSLVNLVYLPIGVFIISGVILKTDEGIREKLANTEVELMMVFGLYVLVKCIILPVIMIIINFTCK
jgi:hypothetical protein